MGARFVAISWLSILCLAPSLARAGNDDELFVGNQAAMVGGAVSATVTDSSSTWYNPAGLGKIDRDQVDVSATVYTLRLYSVPDFIETTTGEADDGAVAEFVVAPSQIAYVRRLERGLSLGLGYFVPRATNYVLREAIEGGRTAERTHWQIAATVAEVQHYGAAGLGYEVSPRVRIGASLIGGYVTSTQSIALFGSAMSARQPVAAASVNAIGTVNVLTMEIGLGLQLELTDAVALGISCRTPQLQLRESIDLIVNRVTVSIADPAAPVLETEPQHQRETRGLDLRQAGRAGIALSFRYGDGWVSGEVDIQPPLSRPRIDVDRKALINARLGWYHALLPSLALGVGLFTDRSGEAKSWDFVSGEGDFYGASIGLELSNEHLLAPTERVKSLVFHSVFALRYAHSAGDFGRTVVRPEEIATGPFYLEKGELNVHELGLYVGSGLRF
jgi:hypothetical protein